MSKITVIALVFLLLNSHVYSGGKRSNKKQVFKKAINSICTEGVKSIDRYRADREPSKNKTRERNFVLPTSCRTSGGNKDIVLRIGTCPDNTMRSQTKDEKLDKFAEDLHKACQCRFKDGCEKKLQFVIREENTTQTNNECISCRSWLWTGENIAQRVCSGLNWHRTNNISQFLSADNNSSPSNSSLECYQASTASTNAPSLVTVMALLFFFGR